MFTAAKIRRQVFYYLDDKPFSVRDFFKYGTRNAVYQEFYRMAKEGIVVRIAHGVFIKASAPMPSVEEVAKTKAAAFKKTVATHGSKAAYALKLTDKPSQEHVFAVNGWSSSFRFGTKLIRFVGTCARKMHLGDTKVGLAIRGLWYLGKHACDIHAIRPATRYFGRSDNETLRENINLMPYWMQNCFDYFDHPLWVSVSPPA